MRTEHCKSLRTASRSNCYPETGSVRAVQPTTEMNYAALVECLDRYASLSDRKRFWTSLLVQAVTRPRYA
jgi:hypothetical protein